MSARNNGRFLDSEDFFTDASEIFARDNQADISEDVPCPEWTKPGEKTRKIHIHAMRGPERRAFDARTWDYSKPVGDPDRYRDEWVREQRPYELLLICAQKPDGSPLFQKEHIEQLRNAWPKPLQRLVQAAFRVNGMDVDDLKLTAKNAEGETTGALASVSQHDSTVHTPEPSLTS